MPKSDSTSTAKTTLRETARRLRAALDDAARRAGSAAIASRVIARLEAELPASLSAYVAMGSEADPAAIVAWAFRRGIPVGLPATTGRDDMEFRRHEPTGQLVDGGFGTSVPPPGTAVLTPAAMVVPLLAFDRSGARLGYGRGYYDRSIRAIERATGKRPHLVGVAFSVQEVAQVPTEPHDVRLDVIATERETIVIPQAL